MKKKILTGLLVVVACGVLSSGLYYWWLITPPPMPQTIDSAAALLKSERFQRLSDDRKLAYLSHIRSLYEMLNAEDRNRLGETYKDDNALRDAMRQVGEQFVVDRAREFALANPAQRQVLLDSFIGMMERRRAERAPRDEPLTEQEQQRRDERRDKMFDRMNNRSAKGNPQHQSYIGEFFKAVQYRRNEIGLPPFRPRGR